MLHPLKETLASLVSAQATAVLTRILFYKSVFTRKCLGKR